MQLLANELLQPAHPFLVELVTILIRLGTNGRGLLWIADHEAVWLVSNHNGLELTHDALLLGRSEHVVTDD